MRQRHWWTLGELEILRTLYPDGGSPAVRARLPHLTPQQIRGRAESEGYRLTETGRAAVRAFQATECRVALARLRAANGGEAFTEAERATLRACFTPEEADPIGAACLALPHRSREAIVRRARRLRLRHADCTIAELKGELLAAREVIIAAARCGAPPPTRQAIAAKVVGLPSVTVGVRLIAALERRGAIRREFRGTARRFVVTLRDGMTLATAWDRGDPTIPEEPGAGRRKARRRVADAAAEARRQASREAHLAHVIRRLAELRAPASVAILAKALPTIPTRKRAEALAALAERGEIRTETDRAGRTRFVLPSGAATAWHGGGERVARRPLLAVTEHEAERLVAEWTRRQGQVSRLPPGYAAPTSAAIR